MITFEKFWDWCWDWFIGMFVVGFILSLIVWGLWGYYEQRTPKYERDFLLCLQSREAELKFYPKQVTEAVKKLEFFFTDSDPEKIIQALANARIFRVVISNEKEKEADKVVLAFRVLSESKMPMDKIIGGLIELERLDSDAPGTGLFDIIGDTAKRNKAIKAIKGNLTDDELPKIGSFKSFLFKDVGLLWILTTFISFLAYLWRVDNSRERWYGVPWSKLGTYAVILFWLPGIVIPAIILGVYKGIFALGNIQVRRERVVEREAEISTSRVSEPERRREQEPRPTASGKRFVVEGLNEEKGLLTREGIVFSEVSITTPLELTGLAFPENDQEKVFNLLGIKPVNLKKIPTNRKNVFLLQYEDIEKFKEKAVERFRKEKDRCRVQYVGLCQERTKKEIGQVQQEIESLNERLQEHSEGIVKNTRTLSTKQTQLQTLENLVRERTNTEKFREEFDKLCSLPYIGWVEVDGEKIKVFTDTILIDYQSRKYEIGIFEIILSLNGLIRIRNLGNKIGDYDHPHIRNEIPCLGNISEGIAKLIASYQFPMVIQILIKFLHQVNPGNWYTSVKEWKEVQNDKI